MSFDVYRIQNGRGLVDYLGVIEGESLSAAEDMARLMFDCDHSRETLEVTEAEPSTIASEKQPCPDQ